MAKNNDSFPANPEIVTRSYRGPDRRKHQTAEDKKKVAVRFDAKGNPVCEIRTEVPRRRTDDVTVDLLKCLDADSLSLEESDQQPGNPYGRSANDLLRTPRRTAPGRTK